jgi:predicted nucleotidyltransferase component of viral defense system
MNILQQSGTDFFLTGGTALSRAYYNHRYSDDLDFFLNNSSNYDEQLDAVLSLLRENGFFWNLNSEYTRSKNFTTFKINHENYNASLKLDFVNDLVPLFGTIQHTDLFYRTDSIQNILSNKLSAIFRYSAKDIADIREIALHESINWSEAINEARQKEAGLELIYVTEILSNIPQSEFETLVWVQKPSWDVFRSDIEKIIYDMISGDTTHISS